MAWNDPGQWSWLQFKPPIEYMQQALALGNQAASTAQRGRESEMQDRRSREAIEQRREEAGQEAEYRRQSLLQTDQYRRDVLLEKQREFGILQQEREDQLNAGQLAAESLKGVNDYPTFMSVLESNPALLGNKWTRPIVTGYGNALHDQFQMQQSASRSKAEADKTLADNNQREVFWSSYRALARDYPSLAASIIEIPLGENNMPLKAHWDALDEAKREVERITLEQKLKMARASEQSLEASGFEMTPGLPAARAKTAGLEAALGTTPSGTESNVVGRVTKGPDGKPVWNWMK